MFVFYSLREVFIAWMLFFAAYQIHHHRRRSVTAATEPLPEVLRAALGVCCLAVVAENGLVLLLIGPGHVDIPLGFFPERNFAENLLALVCEFVALRSSLTYLSVRHSEPPTQGGDQVETYIDHNLVPYAASHKLTPRETEILRLVLLGKDNQNISSRAIACTGNRESARAQYPEEIAESEQTGVDTGLLGLLAVHPLIPQTLQSVIRMEALSKREPSISP